MKRILVVLILIFTVVLECYSQSNENKISNVTFENDGIKFSFFISNTFVSENDTIVTGLEVLNESDSSIFIVPTFHFTYLMDTISQIPNSIYLDFGGSIEDNITSVPFIEVKKNEEFNIQKIFNCSNFYYEGFSEEVYFQLWYGYLKPRMYESFEKPKSVDDHLYFDNFNNKYLKKGLLSLVKIIHKK